MTFKRTIGGIFVISLFAAMLIAQMNPEPVATSPVVDLAAVEQTGGDAWRQIVKDGRTYTVWGSLNPDGKSVHWNPKRQPRLIPPKVIPAFEVKGVIAEKFDGEKPKLRASDPETAKAARATLAKVEADAQAEASKVKPCPGPGPCPSPDDDRAKIPHPLKKAESSIDDYILYAVAGVITVAAVMVIAFGVCVLVGRSPPST